MLEDLNAAGLPRVQEKSFLSTSANEANGAPEDFWHIRQWQMLTLTGAAFTAKRMAPHWQPPVRTGFASAFMSAPSAHRPFAAQQEHRRPPRQNRLRRQRAVPLPARRDGLPDRYALHRWL